MKKFKIYSGNQLYKIKTSDQDVYSMPTSVIDTTEITISIDQDYILSYSITNPTERTRYLYEEGYLGLGLFVEENPSWISRKIWWRQPWIQQRHLTRRCFKVILIDSLSGTIDLTSLSGYAGCWSRQLYYIFNASAQYEDPLVVSGTEKIKVGIGRFYDIDERDSAPSAFRPHKMSDYVETTVNNPNIE